MKKRNNPKIEAMKQRSLIVENERQNLHTPKFYLTEQEEEINTTHDKTYDYKKDETGYYFRRKGSGESGWKKASGTGLNAIKTRVFGSNVKKLATKSSGGGKSSGKPKNIKGFQQWVINTKGDKSILGKGGDSGYGDDGIWGDKTANAWGKYGSEYQNKDKNKEKKSENDKYNAEDIANKLKDSYGGMLGNDKEAWAQSAFEAIADKATYEKVKSILGQDPYKFVKSFMSTNKDYHNNDKTIDGEYKRIIGDDEGKNTKTPEITNHNYNFGFNTLAVSDSLPKNISIDPKIDKVATVCDEEQCAQYVSDTLQKTQNSAWLSHKGKQTKISAFNPIDKSVIPTMEKLFTEINKNPKKTTSLGDVKSMVKGLIPDQSQFKDLEVNDVVGLYWEGSDNFSKAFFEGATGRKNMGSGLSLGEGEFFVKKDGSGRWSPEDLGKDIEFKAGNTLNSGRAFGMNTHLGFVGAKVDGEPIIFHNVHKNVYATPLSKMGGNVAIFWAKPSNTEKGVRNYKKK